MHKRAGVAWSAGQDLRVLLRRGPAPLRRGVAPATCEAYPAQRLLLARKQTREYMPRVCGGGPRAETLRLASVRATDDGSFGQPQSLCRNAAVTRQSAPMRRPPTDVKAQAQKNPSYQSLSQTTKPGRCKPKLTKPELRKIKLNSKTRCLGLHKPKLTDP